MNTGEIKTPAHSRTGVSKQNEKPTMRLFPTVTTRDSDLLSQAHRYFKIFPFAVHGDIEGVTDFCEVHDILDVCKLCNVSVIDFDNNIIWKDSGKLCGTAIHKFTDDETFFERNT